MTVDNISNVYSETKVKVFQTVRDIWENIPSMNNTAAEQTTTTTTTATTTATTTIRADQSAEKPLSNKQTSINLLSTLSLDSDQECKI